MKKASFGIIGLGVMGRSLALNAADNDIYTAVYNRHVPDYEENIATGFVKDQDNHFLLGFDKLSEFITSLETPRKILLMIKAGEPVDSQIKELIPLLSEGDVVLDGGNSHYDDTSRRQKDLKNSGIFYVGMGVSGGEEGARNGPSLMPGGDEKGFVLTSNILGALAAKDKKGKPCVTYVGEEGSGHFVKMVHNGIEYAEMQLLSELYLMFKSQGKTEEDLIDILKSLQNKGWNSYLIEITINILQYYENGDLLLDKILDKSEQKGTGRWTASAGLEHGVPVSPISEAVMARFISSKKSKREKLATLYATKESFNNKLNPEIVQEGFIAASIINHISSFELISEAASKHRWKINLSEVARIWTNGCIIRSDLVERFVQIYSETDDPWTHEWVKAEISDKKNGLVRFVTYGAEAGIPLPVFSATLNLFYGFTTARSGANLIQAQRDYFGAHTYQRLEEKGYFHTDWIS